MSSYPFLLLSECWCGSISEGKRKITISCGVHLWKCEEARGQEWCMDSWRLLENCTRAPQLVEGNSSGSSPVSVSHEENKGEWVSPRSKPNYHIRFLSHTTSLVPFLFLWQCALLSFASLKKIVIVKKTAIDGFKIKKMCFWCPIGNYGNTWPDATLAPPLGTNFNYGSSFYRKLICFRFF